MSDFSKSREYLYMFTTSSHSFKESFASLVSDWMCRGETNIYFIDVIRLPKCVPSSVIHRKDIEYITELRLDDFIFIYLFLLME